MSKYLLITLLSTLTLLSGCANRSKLIIDPQGVDMQQYQVDLGQCEQLSRQVDGKALGGAVGGAVVGSVVGSIVNKNDSKNKLGKLGALSGALKGAKATKLERRRVVRNCMSNRGYSVLN